MRPIARIAVLLLVLLTTACSGVWRDTRPGLSGSTRFPRVMRVTTTGDSAVYFRRGSHVVGDSLVGIAGPTGAEERRAVALHEIRHLEQWHPPSEQNAGVVVLATLTAAVAWVVWLIVTLPAT